MTDHDCCEHDPDCHHCAPDPKPRCVVCHQRLTEHETQTCEDSR